MQGPAAVLNVITVPPGAQPGVERIVIDGFRGAIFEYANGAGLGISQADNPLVGSWASSAGTDPYGNSYPAGLSITGGGSIVGLLLFLYSASPALGDLIVSAAPTSGTDSKGNAYLPGVVSYFNAGGFYLASSLYQGSLILYIASTEAGPWTQVGQIQPASVQGMVATPGMSIGIPGLTFLSPSGDTTGTQDVFNLSNFTRFGYPVVMLPGNWYFKSGLTLPAGTAIYASEGVIINDVSGFTGTAIFYPNGNNITLSGFSAILQFASLVDFQNVNVFYFTMRDVNATSGIMPTPFGAPDTITNFNLHRSDFENCIFTQNSYATSILTMGASGTGLSTVSFRNCKFIATCGIGGVGVPANRTVPALNIQVPGNKNLDNVHFEDCWFNNAMNSTNLDNGEYFVSIACTEGGAAHDEDRLFFTNCSGNQVLGGFIQLQSIVGAVFDKVSVGNVFSVTTPDGTKQTAASFINIGTFAGGQHSQAISIRDYEREGTANLTSGSNPSDIQISSDTVNVLVENPHVPDTGGNIQIDTGGCSDFNLIAANTNLVFVTLPGTGSVQANGVLTLYKASGGVAFSVNGGNGQVTTAAGLAQNISGSFVSNVNVSTVTSTTLTSVGFRSIPANDVVTGARYHGYLSGKFSTGATAPSGATFGVYWGGVAGTLLCAINVPSIPVSATGDIWSFEFDVVWTSTTACEARVSLYWTNSSGTQVFNWNLADVTGLTTTAAENLACGFQWGSAPASTSLAVNTCLISRIA